MSTYRSPAAFRAALEARLAGAAAAGGRPNNRARKLVAFSRLLARLQESAPGLWVLKGGLAMELRLQDRARATRDADLDWRLSLEEATDAIIAATALDLGDYFEFQIERADDTGPVPAGGVRFRADAMVAGRVFEQLAIDVGLVTELPTPQETLHLPNLLGFAGIPATTVPATSLQLHLAEKLHAYTRRYGDGRESSRPKDLIDMVLISELANFGAEQLRETINQLFQARATHPVPISLPGPPAEWSRPYGTLAREVGLEPDLRDGHRRAARLLDPVLSGEAPMSWWNPSQGRWG